MMSLILARAKRSATESLYGTGFESAIFQSVAIDGFRDKESRNRDIRFLLRNLWR